MSNTSSAIVQRLWKNVDMRIGKIGRGLSDGRIRRLVGVG